MLEKTKQKLADFEQRVGSSFAKYAVENDKTIGELSLITGLSKQTVAALLKASGIYDTVYHRSRFKAHKFLNRG